MQWIDVGGNPMVRCECVEWNISTCRATVSSAWPWSHCIFFLFSASGTLPIM